MDAGLSRTVRPKRYLDVYDGQANMLAQIAEGAPLSGYSVQFT
jgi:hypothetical protein